MKIRVCLTYFVHDSGYNPYWFQDGYYCTTDFDFSKVPAHHCSNEISLKVHLYY